jgi:hypothetical protein
MKRLCRIFLAILICLTGSLAEEKDQAAPLRVVKFPSPVVSAYAATPLPLLPPGAERDRLIEELKQKWIPPQEPADFVSLRAKADAMAAKQSSSFKLHQVGTELEFPSGAVRIREVGFHYFQPLPHGQRWSWEELKVPMLAPVKLSGRESRGSIMGSRSLFEEAVPTPAPSNIIAPEKAITLLNRGPMSSPQGRELKKEDSSRWRLTVQLIHIGAKYWAGNPHHFPTSGVNTGEKGTYVEEPFFVKTAPRGKWVWWTVVQHLPGAGSYKYTYEYIYMDPVSGKATSHCAGQPVTYTPLVAVSCPPPHQRP